MTPQEEFDQAVDIAYKRTKQDAEKVWSLVNEEVQEPEPLLLYKNQPVIFKNTMVMVQGKSGTHKSRLAAAIASLMLSNDPNRELLGFKNGSMCELRLIYCDTERNLNYQLPTVVRQIMHDSDLSFEELQNKFSIFPLMNVRRHLRTNVIGREFRELKKNLKTHCVVILDIVSDLVSDFNSVQSTFLISDAINEMINTDDITFIAVIHENPNSIDKARGHLGTELSNKASTIFQIAESNVKDVYSVKMLKSRSTERYEEVLLKFDKSINNLVVVTDTDLIMDAADPDVLKIARVIGEKNFTTIERPELISYISEKIGWKERKIEEKLKKIIDLGIQIETLFGPATLSKTRGRTTEYELIHASVNNEKIEGANI